MKIKAALCTLIVSFLLGSASYHLVAESSATMGKKETNRNGEEINIISPTDDQDVGVKGIELEPRILALNCIKPIKPILPIKPIWCTGTWTLILQCDQFCNCEWVPMCIE